jgi:hypothetical protein
MKLLPIVGRELRESSRRRGTYWLRARVASQAVLIGIVGYVTNLVNPALKLGTVLFWGLAGVSMLFCLLAGRRSTADCLSQEKREGTLGLLFLTDLKGYDVVLGKLAATSVTGLYALLAVFPVLAVPLVTGGMTGGEVGRMLVVLTNTFFFSIAIGIFSSAVSREHRAAMAANFLLWLGLVGAPAACGVALLIARSRFVPPFFYSCPIFSFLFSADANFSTAPDDFWWSIGVTQALAWILALLACWFVPRTWGDKPERAAARRWRWRDIGSWINYGNPARRNAFRTNTLDSNAYFWHAARARLKPLHVWLFLGLAGTWWIYCWIMNGHIWLDEATYVATTVVLNSSFKLWITLEAGQRLGEDRRSGAFELLLPTPLTVSDILRGQWLALRRQFLKPLLLVIVVEAVFITLLHGRHKIEALAVTAALVILPFDIAALICVSMTAALRSRSQTQAAVVSVARILMLPWLVWGILHAMIVSLSWLALLPWEPNVRFEVIEWFCISLVVDLILGARAWLSLLNDFRRLATQTPAPVNWRLSLKRCASGIAALAGRAVPGQLRIPVVAGLGVVAVVGVVHFARPKRSEAPSPVIVSLTQSNAPLRVVFGGPGVFFVLPDGSLWRWGKAGGPQTPRAVMPQQMGTNHDWLKVVADWNSQSLGLRADGTIWELGYDAWQSAPIDATNGIPPQPAIGGSNWVDIGTADPVRSIALKKDGTIWEWNCNMPFASRQTRQIGTASNWTALSRRGGDSNLGLRSDGTLWIWGRITTTRNGSYWTTTNIDAPVLLCADTNWTGFEANGVARNQVGELWDTTFGPPNANAGAATVCRKITSTSVTYRSDSAPYWLSCQIRSNGTLWASAQVSARPAWNLQTPAMTIPSQIGNRSDWVAIWGISNGTAYGLTADGVLWFWGVDVGREPVIDSRSRVQLLRAVLNGRAQGMGNIWGSGGAQQPILEEPRPLMKLVTPPTP